ncbi:MAG TPA: WGR domain-containing protein [Myxococcota bacterium]|nr:WGR domain-containing protein [Myxococcota bacterium]HRY92251.1 WGR domain-containing protein [Myxococcota bacterium]HSA21335.1 WGR domain-containing protein [Myxococcota bacterium]
MRRFEFSDGSSNKFWEIELDGKSFTVRYGRIGADGQTQEKSFPTPEKAKAEHDKLVREKLGKGYQEVGAGGAAVPAAKATKATKGGAASKAPAKAAKAKAGQAKAGKADQAADTGAPASLPTAEGGLVIKGYRITLDDSLEPRITNPAGNVLSSVPDAVRKSDEWQQIIALRENHRNRLKANTLTIEGWMLGRRTISSARLLPLLQDPAWARPLGSLLVTSGDSVGFVVGGDPGKGLGLLNRDLETEWVKRDAWRIPHPLDLPDLEAWQRIAAENGLRQGVLQLMRPLHRPESKEATDKSTDRFSEREFSSTIQLSYAFGARAWAASRGTASRTFEMLEGEELVRISAEFEYAKGMEDYGDMNGECTTGGLSFFAVKAESDRGDQDDEDGFLWSYRKDKALQLKEIPPSIFSEACCDVETVLASIRK